MRMLVLAFSYPWILGASCLLLAPELAAQGVAWSLLPNQPGLSLWPPRRIRDGFTRDDARGTFVLFGGADLGTSTRLADTWLFDGMAWRQQLVVGPSGREGHGLTFDPLRQEVVLFGGLLQSGAVSNETWIWNGSAWSLRLAVPPPARWSTLMVFYPPRNRVVMLTGRDASTYFDDTWEWDGTNWTQTAMGLGQRYSPRFEAAAAYHAGRNRIVLFGGINDGVSPPVYPSDTWEYDGTSWNVVPIANPAGRHTPAMCYSPTEQAILMFGGELACTMRNDAWKYDGHWTLLQQDGSTVGPSPRGGAGMAFDPVRNRIVVAQGRLRSCVNHADSPETWVMVRTPPAAFTTFGVGCLGSAGLPTLAAQAGSVPRFGETLLVSLTNLPAVANVPVGVIGLSNTMNNGSPGPYSLPFNLAAFGMPGCTQYVSIDATVFLLSLTGQVTWPIGIPSNAGLAGLTFHVQALVIDVGINPLGATVTNAGNGVIGG
jgi:hypothetical protein